jgi:eukaryotic-like serine/threonine-protein kinase
VQRVDDMVDRNSANPQLSPQRWEQIKDLFQAALERPEADRANFLVGACDGDDELRQEVQSLLSAHRSARSFMDCAPTANADSVDRVELAPIFSEGEIISGRFRIVRFLSRGGMGEVYEAVDQEINTHIALKTIYSKLSSDARSLNRFKQEIQLARRVTHPNVCRIYNLERYTLPDGSGASELTFLTMELLEGETLADRLRRRGRMSPEEALPLIRQIAAGMTAAHDAGVIHRDLKPSNVMLVSQKPTCQGNVLEADSTRESTDQAREVLEASREPCRAVITDFGLAKVATPGPLFSLTTSSLTVTGQILGTPPYMAPEQLEGREATAASDIYALGLMMYEMLTGQLPFSGQTSLLSRLKDPPPSPRTVVPSLSPSLESVIMRCLESEAVARFSTAKAIADALSQESSGSLIARLTESPNTIRKLRPALKSLLWAGVVLVSCAVASLFLASRPQVWESLKSDLIQAPTSSPQSVVVLPISPEDAAPTELAECNGLTETVTTSLGQSPSLLVPAAFEVKDKKVRTVEDARAEFGAKYVFSGAWQQIGSDIRITLSLIDTRTQRQARTRVIDGATADLLALQDRVVEAAYGMLEVRPPSAPSANPSQPAPQPTAYDYYLQGRGYLLDYEKLENVQSAITVFQRALSLEKNYAPALAGLGEAYWHDYELTNQTLWIGKAKAACQHAVVQDSHLAAAHVCLGTLYQGTGHFETAVSEFLQATALDPRDGTAVSGLALAYESMGKLLEAENTYRHAISLQRQYWAWYNWLGVFYADHDRLADAARMFHEVIQLAPDSFRGYSNLGGVLIAQGKYDEAEHTLRRSLYIRPTESAYSNIATAYFFQRRFADAAPVLERAVKLDPSNADLWGNLGIAYYWAPGERPKAGPTLSRAIELAKVKLAVNRHDATVLGQIAGYYSMMNDKREAFNYMARALALKPEDSDLLLGAAAVHNQFSETDVALDYLQRSLAAGEPTALVVNSPDFDNLHANRRYHDLIDVQRDPAR